MGRVGAGVGGGAVWARGEGGVGWGGGGGVWGSSQLPPRAAAFHTGDRREKREERRRGKREATREKREDTATRRSLEFMEPCYPGWLPRTGQLVNPKP